MPDFVLPACFVFYEQVPDKVLDVLRWSVAMHVLGSSFVCHDRSKVFSNLYELVFKWESSIPSPPSPHSHTHLILSDACIKHDRQFYIQNFIILAILS